MAHIEADKRAGLNACGTYIMEATMERDQTESTARPNEHETYDEQNNMDRAAQSGSEGAFGDDNPDSTLTDMRRDAEAAFGEADADVASE